MSLKTYFTAGGVHTEPLEPHHGVRGVSKGLNLPAHLEEGGGGGGQGGYWVNFGRFSQIFEIHLHKKTKLFWLECSFRLCRESELFEKYSPKTPHPGLGHYKRLFWVILIYFVIVIVIIVIVIMYISGVK